MDEQTVGERLLTILKEKGVSQAELARRSGRSKSAISDVISGRRNMAAEFATDLANALQIPPVIFFSQMKLLPPVSQETAQEKELSFIAKQLLERDERELDDLIEYARHRLQLAEKRGTYETNTTK